MIINQFNYDISAVIKMHTAFLEFYEKFFNTFWYYARKSFIFFHTYQALLPIQHPSRNCLFHRIHIF